ncbi:MAG: cobalamin biosynthesis protein CbiG [Ilumatobacteraceae bacterium]
MFDRIVVADWSANGTPKSGPDSIWIACRDADGRHLPVENPRTRARAVDLLVERLDVSGRVLLGADFCFGYPSGFATAAGLTGTAWAATWCHLHDALDDDDRNRNNRFDVAADLNERLGALHFWGAPPRRAGRWLTTTKPAWTPDHLPVHRRTERALHDDGHRPFSGWQLLGVGAVGSQSLTGIAALERLRRHPRLAHRVVVWPFETGLDVAVASDAIVVAEVWPSSVSFGHVDHPVKDARQVIALADALAMGDASMFRPDVPVDAVEAVVTEEGWVLRP